MDPPKFPGVTVYILGKDGNAFRVLGECRRAMTEAKLSSDVIKAFMAEATGKDHAHLISTVVKWFNVK